LPIILKRTEDPVTVNELAESLDLVKEQLTQWLNKAVTERKLLKLLRPLRFKRATSQSDKPLLAADTKSTVESD